MASKTLLDKINQGIAMELQVSIQYMWQHVMIKGITSESVGPVFKTFAITEMKHAEMLAERLDYLGGTPTTKPTTITLGGKTLDMLKTNKKAEEDAIALYKEIIKLADKEGDVVTRKMVEGILSDEEEHHNTFTTLLEKD